MKNELSAAQPETASRRKRTPAPGPPPRKAPDPGENGLPAPEIIGHVYARVADVMTPDPISIGACDAARGRALLRQHNVRALVV
ncbi:MAG: hypothetical protein ACLSVD_18280 [Eggerthellaceae bacterium]